jgi:hypothetical protein
MVPKSDLLLQVFRTIWIAITINTSDNMNDESGTLGLNFFELQQTAIAITILKPDYAFFPSAWTMFG